MKSYVLCFLFLFALSGTSNAVTTSFFNASQIATNVASGTTADTINSSGYLFTYTRDKLFTGYADGSGTPIGRSAAISWPSGVQAQQVTVGPAIGPARVS